MKKFKDIVLKSGTFTLADEGDKVYGPSLSRLIRDVLRECGYECISCRDNYCPPDKNVLSPMFLMEKRIKELEDRIKQLES